MRQQFYVYFMEINCGIDRQESGYDIVGEWNKAQLPHAFHLPPFHLPITIPWIPILDVD
jgi:hypothetical protein